MVKNKLKEMLLKFQPESRTRNSATQDRADSPQMVIPTVLASCCETIWFPRGMANADKPHLTASLWYEVNFLKSRQMATRFLKISSNGNKIFKNLVKWQQDF